MHGWTWWMKMLGAIGVVAASFFISLAAMNYFWPPCSGGIALRGPFQRLASGFAYVVPAPSLVDRSDTPEAPKRSAAYVCEGDLPLGPAHAPHGEIETLGRGRFSHFSTYGFIFSTSDNSDPNKNGRTYMAIQP
jgi:hypothetical protein